MARESSTPSAELQSIPCQRNACVALRKPWLRRLHVRQEILIANRGESHAVSFARPESSACIPLRLFGCDARIPACRDGRRGGSYRRHAVGESYLRGDRIVDAALATGGRRPFHPVTASGRKTLISFDQVVAAGLTFIGPSAASIRAMGLKDAAKRLMEKAGCRGAGLSWRGAGDRAACSKAREIGYPVLIKGARRRRRQGHAAVSSIPMNFPRRCPGTTRGKGRLRRRPRAGRKYVDKPRTSKCRCSAIISAMRFTSMSATARLQRRHQKVIEEAPAPGMTEALRKA